MSEREQWKMLHLLYYSGTLSRAALADAGIDCIPDTIQPLTDSQLVDVHWLSGSPWTDSSGDLFRITPAARKLLDICVVSNKRNMNTNVMRVDLPRAFVIMPFSEEWSKEVYERMIEPAVLAAGLECTRGDTILRLRDLTPNLWDEMQRAGVFVAEVSAPNPNVFYELGLVHALGKDAFLFRRKDAEKIPADFGGAHYHKYDPGDLAAGCGLVKGVLEQWARDHRAAQVKALRS